MAIILVDQVLGGREPSTEGARLLQALRGLSNGFIITSLLWGAALSMLLDVSARNRLLLTRLLPLVHRLFARRGGNGVWPRLLHRAPEGFCLNF